MLYSRHGSIESFMVALFGYMRGWQGYVLARRGHVHGWQGYVLARRGYVPGWQGYVVALLVEGVLGRGSTCPVGVVHARSSGRARSGWCVPGWSSACPAERLFLTWQEGFAGFDRLVGLVRHPGHPGPLDSLSSNTA